MTIEPVLPCSATKSTTTIAAAVQGNKPIYVAFVEPFYTLAVIGFAPRFNTVVRIHQCVLEGDAFSPENR